MSLRDLRMMVVTICVIAGHHFHFDFSSLAISRRALQELEKMPGLRLLRNLFTMFNE